MRNILLFVTSENKLYDMDLNTNIWYCITDGRSINIGYNHGVKNKNNYILAMVNNTLDLAIIDSKLLRKIFKCK